MFQIQNIPDNLLNALTSATGNKRMTALKALVEAVFAPFVAELVQDENYLKKVENRKNYPLPEALKSLPNFPLSVLEPNYIWYAQKFLNEQVLQWQQRERERIEQEALDRANFLSPPLTLDELIASIPKQIEMQKESIMSGKLRENRQWKAHAKIIYKNQKKAPGVLMVNIHWTQEPVPEVPNPVYAAFRRLVIGLWRVASGQGVYRLIRSTYSEKDNEKMTPKQLRFYSALMPLEGLFWGLVHPVIYLIAKPIDALRNPKAELSLNDEVPELPRTPFNQTVDLFARLMGLVVSSVCLLGMSALIGGISAVPYLGTIAPLVFSSATGLFGDAAAFAPIFLPPMIAIGVALVAGVVTGVKNLLGLEKPKKEEPLTLEQSMDQEFTQLFERPVVPAIEPANKPYGTFQSFVGAQGQPDTGTVSETTSLLTKTSQLTNYR